MIVAIDGPAASGKSSAARGLARRLGLLLLNTGAMYRAVGLECQRRGADLDDGPACAAVARELDLDFGPGGRLLARGEPVDAAIASELAGDLASRVGAHPEVREVLVERQQAIGSRRGLVAEGRDTTTVVFPDAELKVFLWAEAGVRAQRRALQEGHPERTSLYEQELRERDHRDSTRPVGPLLQAPDAVRLDTDELGADEVLERLLALAEERGFQRA